MAEFASKGIAGTGLGLGIAGTALGLLNNNGGGGLLGGVLGGSGGNSQVSALQAEIGELRAENYSDKNSQEVYARSLADNRLLRTELFANINPLTQAVVENAKDIAKLGAEMKCNAEKAELREQIVLGKVNEVALTTKGRFDCLDQTIAGIANTVNGLTKTVIPNSSICPGWGAVCVEPIPCTGAVAK